MNNVFQSLLLIARPAAGKSEIIDYLKRTPLEDRMKRFHIGQIEEIDDFPMLWTWFEEDALLEKMGYERLHTDANGYFKEQYLWDLLIERINLEYQKKMRDMKGTPYPTTVLIEFSRGSEHGGYKKAFAHLSSEIANHLAILFINVSWEESQRKNRKRFNPERADSILEHGLSDEKLERLYKEIDWEDVRNPNQNWILLQNARVPYVVFENEDDVTTGRGDALGRRLEENLQKLWEIYQPPVVE